MFSGYNYSFLILTLTTNKNMMKRLLSVVVAAVAIQAAVGAKTKKKPVAPKTTTIEIINKVNDHWQATHKAEVKAFWDDAAYFTGNMEAYKLTGNARFLEYSDRWARHNHWSGATETDHKKWLYRNYGESQQHVLFGDWQICFQTYLDMYAMNPDAYKIARAKEVMDRECAMSETDFWWWADALYMVMPVMTKLYKATGDTKYLDKLYDNFCFADSLMFDSEAGLYFRDGRYVYPKHKTDSGKKDFWARGDGWVLAGLAKVLTDMPQDYKHRQLFVSRFRQLAASVAKCQQKEGYWTRSMLDPEQAEGPETSGTAFFTYGLLWGMNHGLLDRATYEPVVDKAWQYLVGTALQTDGSVGYVQPIGDRAVKGQQLSAKSVTNFGTGAFLLAACEKVRFDDGSVNATDDKAFTLTFRNDTPDLRHEVVELDAQAVFSRLGISGGRQFCVFNSVNQEQTYQLTYDGKLLLDVSVRPGCQAVYTVKKGVPAVYHNTCYGRLYPERLDDIAWENDYGAYRCYGPALQQRGERSFGYDVWVKNTPDLVVEERYHIEEVMHAKQKPFRGVNKAAVDSIEHIMSYHLDHGYGLDAYGVGASLGCGTPALMDGDNILFPYCYHTYRILDNGPLRFTVELEYNPVKLLGDTAVVEHRIVSLDKGSNFNRTTVWYDGLTRPATFCSGLVLHTADTTSVKLGNDYVAYADPSDKPAAHNFQTFMGVVFPSGGVTSTVTKAGANGSDIAGHLLCRKSSLGVGEKITYYFGTSWSKYDCRSIGEWLLRIDALRTAVGAPLKAEF